MATFAGEALFARKHMHKTRKRKTISHFRLEKNLEFSKQIDADCRLDQVLGTKKNRTTLIFLCHMMIQRFKLEKSNLERHYVSKIVWNAQHASHIKDQAAHVVLVCQRCQRCQRLGETLFGCGYMLQGITEEVKKQAEQRISSRFIMYGRGNSQFR